MQNAGKSARAAGSSAVFALIGLPFLGFGCFMGHKTVSLILDWHAAKAWVQADAGIASLELEERGDDDSSSCLVVATYTYTYEGTRYHGDRVGLIADADNIGSWQEDTFSRLNKNYERGEPVPCYVDPANPRQALLDRELRLAMLGIHLLFFLMFGGVGGGLIVGGLVSGRRTRAKRALEQQHPGAPWLANPAWASGTIRAGTGSIAIWLWIIAFFWNGVSWVVPFILIPKAIDEGAYWFLVFLLFPVIGIAIIYSAVLDTLGHFKFGRSVLEMKWNPGVIGGNLRGNLVIVGKTSSIGAVSVTLQCKRSVTEGHGRHRTTNTETVWSDSRSVDSPAMFGGRITLPIDFEIPYSCPAFGEHAGGDISWHVLAAANIPGVDLELDFEIPVFKTDASDPAIDRVKVEKEGVESADRNLDRYERPVADTLEVETDMAGNTCYRNSALPSLGMLLFLLPLTLGFTGAVVFFGWAVIQGNWIALAGVFAFGFFDLIFWVVILSFVGSYHARVTPDALVLERRFLVFKKTRTVSLAEISKVSHKQSVSSGKRKWFAVRVHRASGRTVTVLGMIRGEAAAKWLVRQIEKRLPKRRQRSGNSAAPRPDTPLLHAIDQ